MTARARKLFLVTGILLSVVTACLGLETKHSNHLGWALLLAGTAFTTIGCVYLGAWFIRDGGRQPENGRSLILPGLGVLIISLITPLEYLFLPSVLPRSDLAQDIGLILFAGGLAAYLLSSRGSKAAPVKRPAVETMRSRIFHSPIPGGLLLMMFGLGVGYSSMAGLSILLLLVLLILFYKSRVDPQRYAPGK